MEMIAAQFLRKFKYVRPGSMNIRAGIKNVVKIANLSMLLLSFFDCLCSFNKWTVTKDCASMKFFLRD